MTDTPTRAEVEARLSALSANSVVGIPDGTPDAAKRRINEACQIVTALLPLAYTETGTTWLAEYKGMLLAPVAQIIEARKAAERRLAEVEAELELLREKQE